MMASGDPVVSQILEQNSEVLTLQLNSILNALNISIAQQTLLSGDLLIPKISEIVFSNEQSDLRNNLIVAMDENPTLAQNVLVYWLNENIVSSRNMPKWQINEGGKTVSLPASRDLETSTENTIYNLVAYDEFYLNKLGYTKDDEILCDGNNVGWQCILTKNVNIDQNMIVLNTSRLTDDGEIEISDSYKFALPTSKALQDRKIRVRGEVYDLVKKREEVIAWADSLKIGSALPSSESLWALPPNSLF